VVQSIENEIAMEQYYQKIISVIFKKVYYFLMRDKWA